jgi:Zn-dependent alcohol dehydrogenases
MRAAVLQEYGEPLAVEEVPEPEPGRDEAVVAVEACGLCRSDWHAWQGHGEWANDQVPVGQVLGHEPAGEVVETGADVDTIEVGDEVVVPFSLGCGSCEHCQEGRGNVCHRGSALGFEPDVPGAFAQQVVVPAPDYNLALLPDTLSPRGAAALGCRYATAYHALVDRVKVSDGDWLAVHGCGGVGLSTVQLGNALGARVIAVDIDDDALGRAANLGAVETVSAATQSPASQIESLTGGGADVSFDAVGISETCRNSVACLRERGIHAQVGLTTAAEKGQIALPTDQMTRWEISFVGCRGIPPTRLSALFELIATTDIEPGKLVTRDLALEEVSDRLAVMDEYDTAGVEVVTEFAGQPAARDT